MDDIIRHIINTELFTGDDGLTYQKLTIKELWPRKTYLKGTMSGKYRGDKLPEEGDSFELYEFEIYEATVVCDSEDDFNKNESFIFPDDFGNIINTHSISGRIFPKEKLPKNILVTIIGPGREFGINLLEPQIFEFEIIRKFHQNDGDKIYGSFTAYVTGYVFDRESKIVTEIVGPIIENSNEEADIIDVLEESKVSKCSPTKVKTGNFQSKNGYTRYEYFCAHHNDTVWGPYIKDPSVSGGCLPSAGNFLAIAIIGLFIFYAFPIIAILFLFYLTVILIDRYSSVFRWLFGVLGIIFWLFFIVSIFKTCSSVYVPNIIPKPKIEDRRENVVYEPIDKDSTAINIGKDSLVKRFRKWQDYDGNIYQGYYTLNFLNVKQTSRFKNNINLTSSTPRSYDQMVFMLKGNDEAKLVGMYRMFDSIKKANQLNDIKFSEMVVSCIQDIPYTLILENDCNAQLYNDKFIRDYLRQGNRCSGYQKFGINSPLEFIYTLEGDCDTRALLLYTILTHYKFDVALMSSEFYGHSMIAINLPFSGVSYNYNNKKYVMWETTAPDIPAGRINRDFLNLNYWRISLKSN
ncbi:hypothetical protein [Flavobacterium stagni]|uniref:Transglutaminase-like domain-containing protein n=1 Tax=Flavobacterium stagni TaxID=2506421 RepID=A0A4Q1K7X2_9FLAO|nr:hypothetical protein [Flavobacterium stagni]RXR21624.1 hypothetical protein EQG61_11475 [Flavobacterium stagni]